MEVRVQIEIAKGSGVKYEHDQDRDCLVVDRFLSSSCVFPFNYGYIVDSLGEDGDPVDVVLIAEYELLPGVQLPAIVIGALETRDEKGNDPKVLCVPHPRLRSSYSRFTNLDELSDVERSRIFHFFSTYKQAEPGKFCEVREWQNAEVASAYVASRRVIS